MGQNPEINLPADRAIGHKSDFNDHDLVSSEAFEYRPQGQKIVARKVDVDAGIANYVGEIIRLSLPVYVKKDGTLLVKVGGGNRGHPGDPCSRQPDPCSHFPARPRCVPFPAKSHTVKCLGLDLTIKIELRWNDPVIEVPINKENDIALYIVPTSDGSLCPDLGARYLKSGVTPLCGVIMGENKIADSEKFVKESAVLSTLPDGTSPKDYTYAVVASGNSIERYNLNTGNLKLTVYDDTYGNMQAVQVLTVPQGDAFNQDNRGFHFFGCLRPNMSKIEIDPEGKGFYNSFNSNVKNTGLDLFHPELCEKLRNKQ